MPHQGDRSSCWSPCRASPDHAAPCHAVPRLAAPAQATAREKSSLWIKRVHWRIPVWGPDGPMVEGEDL